MIQIFHVQAPLGDADPEPLIATLQARLARLQDIYPGLRGARVQASEGFLELILRCAGRDRWVLSRTARTIASSMLRRVKLDPKQATVVGVDTAPSARTLTKQDGRNPNHTARGPGKKRWDDVAWESDPAI